MSPVATAPVEAPPAPPGRPGFFAVAWATFLGYVFTLPLRFDANRFGQKPSYERDSGAVVRYMFGSTMAVVRR